MDRVAAWALDERLPSETRTELHIATREDGRRARVRRLRGPVLLSDDERAAFVRDLERLRGVAHDALLNVLDGGEHEGDLYVVTADLPEGAVSLHELRRRARATGGPGVGLVLHVGAQLAAALGALHEAGVTHGALDPHAVFIDPDGAVFLDAAGSAPLASAPLDEPRGVPDDVRRLGVLLWEALVDRRLLFGGAEPPSRLRADVPEDVDAVLVRALDPEPARRYLRMEALGDALARAARDLDGAGDARALLAGEAPAPAPTAAPPDGRVRWLPGR